MSKRYAIDSYAIAEDRMRSWGHIFDVGQLSPGVLSQLYRGVELGIIRVSVDSWPLRGYLAETHERRTVFELARKD